MAWASLRMTLFQGDSAASGARAREQPRPAIARPPQPRSGADHRRRTLNAKLLGDWFLHAPQALRAMVRAAEIWLVVLAAQVGVGG